MGEQEIIQKIADLQAELERIQAERKAKSCPEPSDEAKAKAKELNPIDDVFFVKMGESPEVCEEIISTVLQFPIKVLRVIPQNTIQNLQGRSVRLDALAEVVVKKSEGECFAHHGK